MATEYMDTDRVSQMAKGFETAGTVLKKVSQVLEVQMRILDTTAFIGAVGGAAVSRYLDVLKPQIDQLAQKCDEVSADLNRSVNAWIEASNAN